MVPVGLGWEHNIVAAWVNIGVADGILVSSGITNAVLFDCLLAKLLIDGGLGSGVYDGHLSFFLVIEQRGTEPLEALFPVDYRHIILLWE